MAANSAIQWTHHTFNPWSGCSKVHDGCKFCYAEVNYSVKMRGVKWGPNGTRVKASEAMWREPLKWNRGAEKAGERRRVFCASLADVFEDWQGPVLDHRGVQLYKFSTGETLASDQFDVCNIGERLLTLDDLRRDLFTLIDSTPMLDWLLLTKRPENVRRMWTGKAFVECGKFDENPPSSFFRDNVWIGTSISDQATADEWIPRLLECRDLCPVRFLSCEPLLGPIDLSTHLGIATNHDDLRGEVGWVIVGGESGHGARPCDTSWVRSIVRQCRDSGVACFVKQLGQNPVSTLGGQQTESGTKQFQFKLADKKGGDIAEWPADLRVREFPSIPAAV